MSRLTWSKLDGSWGIEGVDLSALPPRVYSALMKLKNMEEDGDRMVTAAWFASRYIRRWRGWLITRP